MNVSFSIFRWFDLNDQVNAWYIKTTRCNIGSDKYLAFASFEFLESNFTLSLSNFTVNDFNVLAHDLVRKLNLVRLLLLAAEDDGLTTSIASEDVSESRFTVLVRTIYC